MSGALWVAVAVGLVLALAGCGGVASAARPVTTAVSKLTPTVPYRPAPPQLPAGHAAGALYVLDLTNIGKVEPATLAFASNAILLHLRWSNWGGTSAVAHGTVLLRDCHPDCATGPVVPYPGTIKLSRVASCYDARFYVASSVVAETRNGPWRLASFTQNPCSSKL